MQREIKFKFIVEDGLCGPYELGDKSIVYYMEHNYLPLQYTGLKDKNGVEIYEGDIVKVKEYYQENYIVRYSAPTFLLYDGKDGSLSDFYWWNWQESEVIGNIYDKSEMINE